MNRTSLLFLLLTLNASAGLVSSWVETGILNRAALAIYINQIISGAGLILAQKLDAVELLAAMNKTPASVESEEKE